MIRCSNDDIRADQHIIAYFYTAAGIRIDHDIYVSPQVITYFDQLFAVPIGEQLCIYFQPNIVA